MLNGLPGEETATRLRRLVEPQMTRLAAVNFILEILYFHFLCIFNLLKIFIQKFV